MRTITVNEEALGANGAPPAPAAGTVTIVLRSGEAFRGCDPFFQDLDGDVHPLGHDDDQGLGLSRLFRSDRVVLRCGDELIHVIAAEIAAVKVHSAS